MSFAADLQMDSSLDYEGTFNPVTANFGLKKAIFSFVYSVEDAKIHKKVW